MRYSFVWDDSWAIEPSVPLSGCGLGAVLRVFDPDHWLRDAGPSRKPFRPIREVGFLLSREISRGGPFGYHLLNLCVHGLNTLLVLWLGWLLFRNLWAAGVASLVFAAHPVHTEAVAWAKNSAELLAFFFSTIPLSPPSV